MRDTVLGGIYFLAVVLVIRHFWPTIEQSIQQLVVAIN